MSNTDTRARRITKIVVSNIVSVCAGAVVKAVISNNTTPEEGDRVANATVTIGSFGVGMFVADRIKTHTDDQVDVFFDALDEFRAVRKSHKS